MFTIHCSCGFEDEAADRYSAEVIREDHLNNASTHEGHFTAVQGPA